MKELKAHTKTVGVFLVLIFIPFIAGESLFDLESIKEGYSWDLLRYAAHWSLGAIVIFFVVVVLAILQGMYEEIYESFKEEE